jgi:hypothetical protein
MSKVPILDCLSELPRETYGSLRFRTVEERYVIELYVLRLSDPKSEMLTTTVRTLDRSTGVYTLAQHSVWGTV